MMVVVGGDGGSGGGGYAMAYNYLSDGGEGTVNGGVLVGNGKA